MLAQFLGEEVAGGEDGDQRLQSELREQDLLEFAWMPRAKRLKSLQCNLGSCRLAQQNLQPLPQFRRNVMRNGGAGIVQRGDPSGSDALINQLHPIARLNAALAHD